MHILKRDLRRKVSALYLFRNFAQILFYRLGLFRVEQSGVREHPHMRDAPADIRRGHAPVKVQRLGKVYYGLICILCKTALPHQGQLSLQVIRQVSNSCKFGMNYTSFRLLYENRRNGGPLL